MNNQPKHPWCVVDAEGRKFVRVLRTEAYFEYRTFRNSAGQIVGQLPVEKHRVIEEFQQIDEVQQDAVLEKATDA